MVRFLDAKHHHIDRNKLFSRFLKWYPMLPPTNQRQSPIRDLKDYKGLDNMIPVIAKMIMNSQRSKISYHKSKHWIIANTTIDTLKLNLYIKKLVQPLYHHFRRIHCNLKSRLNVNRERTIALLFYNASLILLTKYTLNTKGNITLLIKSSFANLSFVA